MKTTKLIFAFVIALIVTTSVIAQSNENQLYYVWEQKVVPDKIDNYIELTKTWVSACKEHDFPFLFSVWQSNIYDFYWFFQVDDYNHVEELRSAGGKIYPKMEDGFLSRFYENVEYTETFFIKNVDNLSYTPETKVDGLVYAEWWIHYMKPRTEMKFRKAFRQAAEMQKNANDEYPTGVLHSDIGMKGGSSYISAFSGKDEADLYTHQAKAWESLGEETQQMIRDLTPIRRKFEKIPFWYRKNMSYSPE